MASLIASAPWKYDVFLSSSSQDAGNFSYLLRKDLNDVGIRTLRDDDEVEGAESTASLELEIRQSKVAIVIISPDYASSPRLLEHLAQFLETHRDSGRLILPVFHFVEPSEVRNQRGTIGASFAKHKQEQDSDKIQRWKAALTSVANINGWNSAFHKNPKTLIEGIVDYVKRRIVREETENIIEQSVDEVSTNATVEEKIIEQPVDEENIIEQSVDEVGRNTSFPNLVFLNEEEQLEPAQPQRKRRRIAEAVPPKEKIITVKHEEQKATVDVMLESHNHTSVEEKIIEQPVDEVSRNTSVKEKIITVKHEQQKATVDATSSAEWNVIIFILILEILSAGFDQASSPRKPHYALLAMLLAAAAVFTCIWEQIQKKSLVLKSWEKLQCISYPHLSDTFFESHLDTYGFVSSIYQCVFSTLQYIYFFHHANSPIRLCALPALYVMCVAGSRLWKKYHKSKTLPV